MKTPFDSWQGRIDPGELTGAPACTSLRSDAVFLVDTRPDGTHQFPVRGDGFNLAPAIDSCGSKYVSFDQRLGPVTDVQGVVLSLADSSIEGPFRMSQGPLGWQVDGPDAGVLGCNRPGYVNIVAAHEDGVLVGLRVALSEDR
jgi:hypothetical protein